MIVFRILFGVLLAFYSFLLIDGCFIDYKPSILTNHNGFSSQKSNLSQSIIGVIPDNKKYTWTIKTFSRVIPDFDVLSTLHSAFSLWEGVTNLKFEYVKNGRADFNINFVTNKHQFSTGEYCPEKFNFNLLAHAYYPTSLHFGEIHINDDQIFNKDKHSFSYSLFHVFAHEIGHAFGFTHNERNTSIMYAREKPNRHKILKPVFDKEDEIEIRSIYKKNL